MSLPFSLSAFLAKRMIRVKDSNRISKPIVRIATAGVAVGMILMILALSIVKGFQQEVRNKVIGFGGHFQVVSNADNAANESVPLVYDSKIISNLEKIPGVKKVSVFGQKPAIAETKKGIAGVIAKGITAQYDTTYLHKILTQGRLPNLSMPADSLPLAEILLSEFIANRLALKVGEKMAVYIVNGAEDIQQQTFTLTGIYKTDLEDYDEKFIFCHLAFLQQYSGWGVQGQIVIDTVSVPGIPIVQAVAFGNNNEFELSWINGKSAKDPFILKPGTDTTLTLITKGKNVLSDTTQAHVFWKNNQPNWTYSNLRGSEKNYIGGYEVQVDEYDKLTSLIDPIWEVLPYDLFLIPLTDRNPEIFSWLEMLDINVIIIIVLMVVLSIVNMTSALLILILERQRFIGILKTLGAANGMLLKVFLYQAVWIIGIGLFLGNALGFGLAYIQMKTGWIKLDPANYYVSEVPIKLDFELIGFINLITIGICALVMILPSLYVSTIQPAAAIRKD
jgi:lipoprotein-releasing system permease protein